MQPGDRPAGLRRQGDFDGRDIRRHRLPCGLCVPAGLLTDACGSCVGVRSAASPPAACRPGFERTRLMFGAVTATPAEREVPLPHNRFCSCGARASSLCADGPDHGLHSDLSSAISLEGITHASAALRGMVDPRIATWSGPHAGRRRNAGQQRLPIDGSNCVLWQAVLQLFSLLR